MSSHWHRISDNTTAAPFFWDELHGMISVNGQILRTDNGCQTWRQCITPSADEITSIYMRDTLTGWAATNIGNSNSGESNTVWQTTDGGWTWQVLPQYGVSTFAMEARVGIMVQSTGGIAFLDSMVGITSVAAGSTSFQPFLFSRTTDGGVTWTNPKDPLPEDWGIYAQQKTGKFFMKQDGLSNGINSSYYIYVSTDTGQSWNRTKWKVNNNGMFWSTGDIEGSADAIYVQGLGTPNWSPTSYPAGVWRSTNGGDTLISVGGPSPGNGPDYRFCVPPTCNGGIVIASGFNGPLDAAGTSKDRGTWMTTDGGDGTLVAVGPPELTQALSGTASKCHNTNLAVTIKNIQCRGITLTSVELEEQDPKGTFQLDTVALPFYLDSGATDSFQLAYTMTQEGTHLAYLHIHGVNDGLFHNPYDTLLAITAVGGPDTGRLSGPVSLSMEAPSACQNSDTLIALINTGCGDLTVLSGQMQPSEFTMDTLGYPLTIHAGDTLFLHVHYMPQDTKTVNGVVRFTTRSNGYTDSAVIAVSGSALASMSKANLAALEVGTISLCNERDTTIVLKNTGCDPFTVNAANLSQASTFTLASTGLPLTLATGDSVIFHVAFAPKQDGTFSDTLIASITGRTGTLFDTAYLGGIGTSSILVFAPHEVDGGEIPLCGIDTLTATFANHGCDTLRASGLVSGTGYSILSGDTTIPPNASGTYRIVFIPANQKGSDAGQLKLHFISALTGKSLDTSAALLVTVGAGTTALSLDTSLRDFGTLFECEERDTTIFLANPGCDTLRVDSAVFSNASYSCDTAFPIVIPANDSVAIRISFVPNISPNPGSDNGAVTFWSDANTGSQTETVPLRAIGIPPAKLTLSLVGLEAPTYAATAGQVVTFYVVLTGDTGAAAKELQSITFDLTHNDDLLTLLQASGLSWSPGPATTTRTDTLAWKVGLEAPTYADTIGTLTFRVYLTDSSTTPLTLSNIAFSAAGLPPDCIASIGENGLGFTYLYQCSEHLLQDAMLGVPFQIGSIVPNPARDKMEVQWVGDEPADLELDDVLGRKMFAHPATLPPSPLLLQRRGSRFDVSQLPAGVYYLRARAGGYVETRRVVIER